LEIIARIGLTLELPWLLAEWRHCVRLIIKSSDYMKSFKGSFEKLVDQDGFRLSPKASL
jgi:hypothetical protein